MAFGNPITGGQGALIRPAIKSPNYVPGQSGWAVFRDGSGEFNNVDVRNGLSVGGVSLWYTGTPAAGNLFLSIAAAAGTDQYGNHYPAGVTMYSGGTPSAQIDPSLSFTGPSFVSHGSQFPVPIKAALSGGALMFDSDDAGNPVSVGPAMNVSYTAVSHLLRTRMQSGAPLSTSTNALWDLNSSSDSDVANVNFWTTDATALDVRNNGVSQPRGIVNATPQPASVTGITTTATEVINTGSITFLANRAYEISVNVYGGSTVAGDTIGYSLHKTNAAGTTIHDWLDAVVLTNASRNQPFYGRKIMRIGAANITTAISLAAVRRLGTGTLTCNDSPTQDPYIEVRDIGSASAYAGFFTLT